MTRIDLRLSILLPAVILMAGASAPFVLASDNHAGKPRQSQPFKDLPGVKQPKKHDEQARTACTSSIERQHATRWRNGLGYRVYRCEMEVFTLESTRPPDEIDWQKQKLYDKPWINDGF